MKRRPGTRRGAVLIAVLVCMGVAVTIVLGVVQASLRERRQLRQELQMEQTKWLMDAGLGHAIAQLNAQPDYAGETMMVAPEIAKFAIAKLEVSVNRIDIPTNQIRVTVTSQLGDRDEQTALTRRSKTIVVRVDRTNQN